MDISRREVIVSAVAAAALTAGERSAWARSPLRGRVIVDNDFSGDPDGLLQLAHHVLCPSVAIPLIIGSHLPAAFSNGRQAAEAAEKARALLTLMNLDQGHTLMAGAEAPIPSRRSWTATSASAAIVREAMRPDAEGPLFYAAGAGLTDLATAWLSEPRIGRRLTLVWIGGNEHPGLAYPPPGTTDVEFNYTIDPVAAQVIFNESDIEIWQVPRDAYRRMLLSNAELDELAATGPVGRFIKEEVDGVAAKLSAIPGFPPLPSTEAYAMGDSPLVTLTALVPPFWPDPSSSRYTLMATPRLGDGCTYTARPQGRPMRVYTDVDAGLTFRDMSARFRNLSRKRATG